MYGIRSLLMNLCGINHISMFLLLKNFLLISIQKCPRLQQHFHCTNSASLYVSYCEKLTYYSDLESELKGLEYIRLTLQNLLKCSFNSVEILFYYSFDSGISLHKNYGLQGFESRKETIVCLSLVECRVLEVKTDYKLHTLLFFHTEGSLYVMQGL
jgi:hypothetical protein